MSEMNQDTQLIQVLTAYVNEAVLIIRADDAKCLYASPLVCQLLQSCSSTLLDKTLFEVDIDLVRFAQWQAYIKQIQLDNTFPSLTRYLSESQAELSVEVRGKCISFQQGSAILLTIRDVSSRYQYENKVVTDQALQTFTLHDAQDGFWDWNLSENSLYLSPHCYRLMSIEPNELTCSVLEQWLGVIHPDDKKAAFQTIEDHVQGKTERFKIKYRLRQKSGDYIWVQGRGSTAQRDDSGKPIRIIGSVIDITESESTTLNLLWHSQHDALTKIYNRKKGYEYFNDFLIAAKDALKAGLPALFQVSVLDIDDFKQVNDQYGHLVGDALLQHFASFAQNYIEQNMVLVRWGGEEFVLLSYGRHDEVFIKMINHLVKHYALTSFSSDSSKTIHSSVSAGVSCFKSEQDSISSLFKAADQAMYDAKAKGKSTFCLA